MGSLEVVQPAKVEPLPTTRDIRSMEALWRGKMALRDFAVPEVERNTAPHGMYKQQDALPVIDIAAINSGDEAARDHNVQKMLESAQAWGFFKIANHGISLEKVKKIEAHGHKFFALPLDRKLNVRDKIFGYTAGSPVTWKMKWWMEALHILVLEDVMARMVVEAYPDDKEYAQEFLEDLTEYFKVMGTLARQIVELLTEAIGLKPGTYTKFETPSALSNGKLNHYPPCPDPAAGFGLPGHFDPQMLTILYQDEVGGLQVKKQGEWIGIKPDSSTFVVNIGDTFKALTNGRLNSAEHRAVLNREKSRLSIGYFYGLDNTITLSVPDELIDEQHPLQYRPFTVNDYRQHLLKVELLGNPIDHLRIKPESSS